jgi:hypothetical protein
MAVDMDISGPLESMDINRIGEVVQKWQTFCEATDNIVKFEDISPFEGDFIGSVNGLLEYGLGSLVVDYFFQALEVSWISHSFSSYKMALFFISFKQFMKAL